MIFLIKRFFAVLTVFCFIFSINANAENIISLKPNGNFFTYGEQANTVSEILGMSSSDLQEYCEDNNILYLAVNSDNSKQIRISKKSNDFSNSVVNITNLSDEKIKNLIPDIIGLDNVKGDIVDLNGQKAVKVELRSSDSGGDFLLTEYYTVANRENYVISFYTNASENTEYIEKTLETLKCPYFSSSNNSVKNWHYIILAAAVIFAAATIFIIITIIRDIRREREFNNSDEETESADINEDEIISASDQDEKN